MRISRREARAARRDTRPRITWWLPVPQVQLDCSMKTSRRPDCPDAIASDSALLTWQIEASSTMYLARDLYKLGSRLAHAWLTLGSRLAHAWFHPEGCRSQGRLAADFVESRVEEGPRRRRLPGLPLAPGHSHFHVVRRSRVGQLTSWTIIRKGKRASYATDSTGCLRFAKQLFRGEPKRQ
jgi:hypothetical protein